MSFHTSSKKQPPYSFNRHVDTRTVWCDQMMGSMTDNVLHRTKNSMLIVRGQGKADPEPDIELETIIVPVDGSRLGEQVATRCGLG